MSSAPVKMHSTNWLKTRCSGQVTCLVVLRTRMRFCVFLGLELNLHSRWLVRSVSVYIITTLDPGAFFRLTLNHATSLCHWAHQSQTHEFDYRHSVFKTEKRTSEWLLARVRNEKELRKRTHQIMTKTRNNKYNGLDIPCLYQVD